MTKIITVAATSANTIGAHGHPVLEEGNLSFPQGRYIVELQGGEDRSSLILTHTVTGAPLISRLLNTGKARHACIVSSPKSFYRKTHLSDGARHRVFWRDTELGEPPLFTPMIFCSESIGIDLNAANDGVHREWDGTSITLSGGSRLAIGNVFDLRSSIFQMITIKLDDGLTDHCFHVDAQTEPFGFVVSAAPALHRYLQQAPSDPIRKNIMTHVVTACFALLQRDFRDDDSWDRNLHSLAEFIEHKYPLRWDDDSFRPEAAATALYPHILPREEAV